MIILMKLNSGETVIADMTDIEVVNEKTNKKVMTVRRPYVVSQRYHEFVLTPFVHGMSVSSYSIPLEQVMFYTSDNISDVLLEMFDRYDLIGE